MAKPASRSEIIGRLKSFISQRVLVEGDSYPVVDFAFLKQIASTPDRTTALLVSTLVHDVLRISITRRLSQGIDRIFADNGVLASFYARSQMAFSLGIIDEQAKADIDAIREVRNAAAHGMLDFQFSEESIASVCFLISSWKTLRSERSEKPTDFVNVNPRERYMSGCFYYLMALGNKSSNFPITPTSYSLEI